VLAADLKAASTAQASVQLELDASAAEKVQEELLKKAAVAAKADAEAEATAHPGS